MLHKLNSIKLTKYIVLIPMLLVMLTYTSCNNLKSSQNEIVGLEDGNEIPYLTNKIKEQIAIQGNVTDDEDKALHLLNKIMKGSDFNPKLVEEVSQLIDKKDKSNLEQSLASLFDAIQIKGNITDSDNKAIEDLLALTVQ